MFSLRMHEWERLTAAENPALASFSFGDDIASRTLAEKLTEAEILEVVELRQGLSIRSTSYVGSIQLGDLQITIQPKIEFNILSALFGYAYNLRDLRLMANSEHDAETNTFQDLLIHQFVSEVTRLLSRGLHRQYRRVEGNLANSKGRIDIQKLARRTDINSADIPTVHHPRLEDNFINQVLVAGMNLALSITTDVILQSRLRRLANPLEGFISTIRLDYSALVRLRRDMNRLTAYYEPSVTLIDLLLSSTGTTLDATPGQMALPGFLFDMNRFFERLLSRFLKENLPGYTVHDQYRLKGMMAFNPEHNPKRRRAPTPRPDFVITDGEKLVGILDAKYRDLWTQSLPREMLYQLAVYALSQGWNGQSIILYPFVGSSPVPQVIEITGAFENASKARIVLTPVDLKYLSELLQDTGVAARARRTAYAKNLLLGGIHAVG